MDRAARMAAARISGMCSLSFSYVKYKGNSLPFRYGLFWVEKEKKYRAAAGETSFRFPYQTGTDRTS